VDTVIANGRPVPVEMPCNLQELLVRQGLLPQTVVVELNGEATSHSDYIHRQLKSGDRLEIVRIVAGG
jgi:sulfur carrier protein